MKHYLNLIILICIFSCKTNNDHINETEFHDFSDIKIDFRTGDEVRTLSRMLILKDSQKIRAVKQSPFYYYGFQTDTIWTTEIGKSDLQLIKSFIIKARNQKDSCSFGSTSIDRYKISIGDSEELKIIGNCEWNNIDYDSLEHKIFQKQFEQLKLKRE